MSLNKRPTIQKGSGRQDRIMLGIYFLCFAFVAAAYLIPFLREGKYLIYGADAFTQQFPAFCYTRQYWKQALSLLLQGVFRLPLYDFSMGLGDDILITMGDNGLGDPFCFFSIFVPDNRLEFAYSALVVLRFALGGAIFYGFCRKLKNDPLPSLIGAALYSGCGFWTLCTVHTVMAPPVFYLPLLLWGTEKAMRGESPWMLALSTLFLSTTSYYFLAICSFALAFFVLIRSVSMSEEWGKPYVRVLAGNILRSLRPFGAGVALSAFLLLPSLTAYLGSNRTSAGAALPELLYTAGYLKDWFIRLLTPSQWSNAALILLCLAVILPQKGARSLRLALGAGLLFVISPFMDAALIGFGASEDLRFWFVIDLLLTYTAVAAWPVLFRLSRVQMLLAVAFALLYTAAVGRNAESTARTALMFLWLTMAVLLAGQPIWWQKKPAWWRRLQRTVPALLLCVGFVNLLWMGFVSHEKSLNNYKTGRFSKIMTAISGEGLPADSRVDSSDVAGHQWWSASNAALVGNYNGLSEYYSVINPYYSNAIIHDWALAAAQQGIFSFQSLDGCAALNTLAGVRYVVTRSGEQAYVPYGYQHITTTSQTGNFTFTPDSGPELYWYENQYLLPLGYSYDRYITLEEYQSLNGLQKQVVLMKALASDAPAAGLKHADAATLTDTDLTQLKIIDTQISQNLVWQDNQLFETTGTEDGWIQLTVAAPAGSELHLRLVEPADLKNGYDWQSFCMTDGWERDVYLTSALNGPEAWVNLGYCEQGGTTTVTFTVSSATQMCLSGLEVWAYDMAAYAQDAGERAEVSLQNVTVGINSVQGLLESENETSLCFAVPFSTGWRATVDGAQVPLSRAGSMFMQAAVPAGSHVVRLYYVTPGLKTGLLISVCGAFWLLAETVFWLRRRKKQRKTRKYPQIQILEV